MVTTTINYIVYTPGHRRHHSGSQAQLIPPVYGTATAGDNIPAIAFDSLPYMGNNVPFAFMSVTGASDGSHLYTTAGTQHAAVGTSNIQILVVYAPVGDGSGEQVYVDAFNADTGQFSDSDFMEVYTSGVLDNPKTFTANEDGVVSSAMAEDMRSYTFVDGVPFLEWLKVGGTPAAAIDYNLQQHETGLVFAFYQAVAHIPIQHPQEYREGWIYLSPGVLVGGAGIGIRTGPGGGIDVVPMGPPTPMITQLLTAAAILSISVNMNKEVKADAANLAANHLNSIADSIRAAGKQ